MKRAALLLLMLLLILMALPEAVLACEKCFSGAGGPIGEGISMAMLALIAMTGFIWAGIGGFFVNLHRRTSRMESDDLAVTKDGTVFDREEGEERG